MTPHQPYTEIPTTPRDRRRAQITSEDDHHPAPVYGSASGTRASGVHPSDSSAQTVAPARSTAWYKGADMVRNILIIVGVVILALIGWKLYTNWRVTHPDMSSGAIISSDPIFTSKANPIDNTGNATTGNAPQKVQPTAQPAAASTTNTPVAAAAPSTDSFPPNAPENIKFTGTGKFQLYRQGNITYRLNTDTGQECVLYATDEEWQKPRVWQHGCNR